MLLAALSCVTEMGCLAMVKHWYVGKLHEWVFENLNFLSGTLILRGKIS